MKLRRPNNLSRLPLGIEGVRVRPSLRGLVRDVIELMRAVWARG